MITGAARVAGVVGRPVAHSLSPLIHNAWIDALGLDAVYVPISPSDQRDAFETTISGLFSAGFVGVNVTAPFKERAYAKASLRNSAERYANANVLLFDRGDGDIEALNTDDIGLVAAIEDAMPGVRFKGLRVVLLGAGAAARTAAIALGGRGADVTITNRTQDRAETLASETGSRSAPLNQLPERLASADLLVNATSAGHRGEALDVGLAEIDADATVFEMTYRPVRTPLLKEAEALGLRTIDGLAMLIGQARPSFEAFFGVAPPPAEVVDVRALCLRALGEA